MIASLAANETRRDLLLLIGVCALLYLPALGARDLWNPNEPLYGRAVVEMHEGGTWLLPTVNEQTFNEKPILYFWLARMVSAVRGGVDEFGLRLPGALAGLAATLLLYQFVRRAVGRNRALISGLVFATLYAVFWSARMVQMDLLLTLSVLSTVTVLSHGSGVIRDNRRAWILAGVSVGIGFLAKGPLAFVLPAAILFVRRPTDIKTLVRRGNALWFALTFALVASPWFLALWLSGETQLFSEFFVRQHFQRFVDPWDHQRPIWYFLLNFPPDMAPWSLWLPLCLGLPLRDRREQALDRLAWLWILVPFVIFSLSASKRSIYMLPAAPAVAILVAGLAERFVTGRLDVWRDRFCRLGVALLAAVLFAAALLVRGKIDDYPAVGSAGTATALLLAGSAVVILATLFAHRRRRTLIVLTPLLAVIAIYVQVTVQVLPRVDAYKSSQPFATQVRERVSDDDPLMSYRPWKWRAGYIYYIDRTIPRLNDAASLRDYMGRSEAVYLLVERDQLLEALDTVPDAHVWLSAEVGSNAVHLLSNRPPPPDTE
ncbi:MAG: glycosyltransferase family 39 protein [Acidobacteriota bacterium]|nr:glycosyltransferase family 39 protein [Acidobacteriota bacterium]